MEHIRTETGSCRMDDEHAQHSPDAIHLTSHFKSDNHSLNLHWIQEKMCVRGHSHGDEIRSIRIRFFSCGRFIHTEPAFFGLWLRHPCVSVTYNPYKSFLKQWRHSPTSPLTCETRLRETMSRLITLHFMHMHISVAAFQQHLRAFSSPCEFTQ